MNHRRRAAIVLCAFAAVTGGVSATATRASSEAVACTLVSQTQLRSTLGLDKAFVLRNYDATSPAAAGTNTQCAVGVWSGPTPTTRQAVLLIARSGHGAQVGVETWAPHQGSPSVKDWPQDYDKLTGRFDIEGVTIPGVFSSGGWPSKHFTPAHLGNQTTGFTVRITSGPAKGLVAAVGCWWKDSTYSALCMFVEEAAGKPVVKHLNAVAQIAVPKFL